MDSVANIQEWVNLELSKIEQSYITKGLNMTGAYRREIERSKEYNGRQLLELLQNADDEAENTINPSVLIKLEQDRLIIANNGTPFSEEGILSLMYSDNSPKIRRQKKIGYKGLGFRSILSWSYSIWIKSGQFSIEFSRDNAIEFLKSLLEKHPELKSEIEKASTENEKFPIATLAVPKWKEDGNIDIATYDTYVIINFSSEKIRQDIQEQISELDMEVVLFLNNLKTIKLESPERKESIIRIPPKDDWLEEIQLQNEEGEIIDSKKWRIFKTEGELPEKLRQNEMTKQFEYDLRIAVSEKLDDSINRLFSFFRTEVRFPFPAIIHGTFDLDGNRNHLNLSDVNGFLLEKIAELMIDTAKKLTQVTGEVNWDAMKLLAKKGDFDDKVEKMGFYEKLLDKMKAHKLIPVVSNKYMSVDENPAFFKTPYARIFKEFPTVFQDLSFYTYDSEVRNLIEELGIEKYEPRDFISRLNQITSQLKICDRAEIILNIANNYVSYFKPIKEREMPNLFIDTYENVIGSKTQALMPPERGSFKLPSNVTITFISNKLFVILKDKADVKTGRGLADKLRCFNVQEYRFDSVIRRIVTSIKKFIRKSTKHRDEHIRNMLHSLFSIFNEDTESEKFPSIDVPIITRKGELRNTKELYFGKEYQAGKIMNSLYSNIDDSVFISNKEELGFGNDNETKVTDFLEWIGVARFPRIRLKQISDSAYEDYILRNVRYPYTTNYSEAYGSYEEFKKDKHWYYRSTITIGQIDEFDAILEKARFEDIIVWLYVDSRMNGMIREGYELQGSKYEFRLKNTNVNRTMLSRNIASYIVFKMQTASWIKTESGQKVKPEICCLSKTLIDMSPLIEVPSLSLKYKAFKENKIGQKDIEYILTKIGVSENFAQLSTKTIYSILEKLETADPEGKHARNIYRQIIESKPREWSRKIVKQEARNKFVENGKVLAKGEIGYFPVKSVYYVDNITFCKEIIKKFPIAAIGPHAGKVQVKDIFGVNPLEDIRFKLVEEPEHHYLDKEFSKALEIFKPYILTYRVQKPTVNTELNRLKKLKIVLCTKINAIYKYDDIEDKLVLSPYEHIQIEGENTAYMLLGPEKRYDSFEDLKNDIRFCESFSEIITGILKVSENRKDFRDLFPKDNIQRDLIIKSDLDDPQLEKLKTARDRFKNPSDLENEFWQSILEAKGSEISISELDEDTNVKKIISDAIKIEQKDIDMLYENIDYENLSNSKNLPDFKKLFETIKLSVDEFNKVSYYQIDFTEYFEKEIISETFKQLNKFKSYVYYFLKEKDINEKVHLIALIENYKENAISNDYDIKKELEIDWPKYFGTRFKQEPLNKLGLIYKKLIQQKETDIDEIYQTNKKVFAKKLLGLGAYYMDDFNRFLEKSGNKSLLYYAEYDELVNKFKSEYEVRTDEDTEGKDEKGRKRKDKISLNEKEEEYADDNYQGIMENIDEDLKENEYNIGAHNPKVPAGKQGKGDRPGSGGRGGRAKKHHTKEIGFIGEYYVYKEIVRKYYKEKVLWSSEYAKTANINPNGKDGLGYDIMYLDKNNQAHYVEVKASNDDDLSFPISSAEVRFGEQNKNNYEIIFILNACSRNRSLKNLGNIFQYNEDESFTNNAKFHVENEGFRIRFG